MEKTDKLYLINAKLNEIRESTQMYRENENMYCHFNKVLEHLDAALEEMREHPHWKRPINLPEDMIWSDACNPDDRSDPFAYGGDMPVEDFVRMQDEYFANEGNEVLDAADFRSEAKAEEEIENNEENKSAAGINGCDTGCAPSLIHIQMCIRDSGYCDDAACAQSMREFYEQSGYVMDPHTAIAYKVMKDYEKEDSMHKCVLLSTACLLYTSRCV